MATTVKSFIDRAFNTLTRRRPQLENISQDADEQELRVVTHSEQPLIAKEWSRTPSPVLSPVEPIGTLEADDILFRKNNVYLKHPRKKNISASSSLPRSSRDFSLSSSLGESSDSCNSRETRLPRAAAASRDSQDLIPGFLFITTRGSDFGTTLILNWAPNSSILAQRQAPLVPVDVTRATRSLSLSDSNGGLGGEECSSVSIDLGLMEVIRVFYRIGDNGLILSGEMVITSKDRKFRVRHCFRFTCMLFLIDTLSVIIQPQPIIR